MIFNRQRDFGAQEGVWPDLIFATSYSRVSSLAACTAPGITATCLHPGFVATRFGDQAVFVWPSSARGVSRYPLLRAAETIVYLASSPDVDKTTGQYFYKSVPTTPSAAAPDDRSALLLWQRSAALAGMKRIAGALRFPSLSL